MTDKDVKKIESAIGYVFNDKQLLKTAFTHSTGGLNTSDYKSELQNYTQKRLNGIKPEYEDLEMSDGRPVFRVCVKINGAVYGKGEGSSKKKAQQNAAKEALSKIKS